MRLVVCSQSRPARERGHAEARVAISRYSLPLDLGAQALFLGAQLRRELGAEVLRSNTGRISISASSPGIGSGQRPRAVLFV
jgi:hypothetical protein